MRSRPQKSKLEKQHRPSRITLALRVSSALPILDLHTFTMCALPSSLVELDIVRREQSLLTTKSTEPPVLVGELELSDLRVLRE